MNTKTELTPAAPDSSDESLALIFAERYAERLRYVAAWSHWFIWTGTHWERDETMKAFDLSRAICREAAANNKKGTQIASAKTVAALERLAKADRRLAATVDQWDRDPLLLNTPDGTINLLTGTMRDHRPKDFITKITAVAPGGECPTWHSFLSRVTGDDQDLAAYLQRLGGYALTGITREHCLAFLYGTGANGKSVALGAISGVLGDYHRTAPIDTFTASNTDRHPTELAMLRGARLVTAVETEEGRRWAESRIKTVTGGDKIAARFMRADFFEYTPLFKLIVAGNHRPGLRSVDEAIRRRLHLVPFTITIPPEERDEELPEKLKEEWPGILQWMIDGCLEWQKRGLALPDAVRAATDSYLESEDAIAAWMDECCELELDGWESSSDLFQNWTIWAKAAHENIGSQKRFSQALEARGLEPRRRSKARGFLGLRLQRHDYSDHWSN
jgi:putative DNA primase/helicase